MTASALRVDAIVTEMAALRGDAPALVTEDGAAVSYRDLSERIEQAARALSQAGLRAGDRLLLVGENCAQMIVGLFAALRLSAWAVPLNARLSPGELDPIRAHAGPRLCLYAVTVSPEAAAHAQRGGALTRELPGIGLAALSNADPQAAPEPVENDPSRQVAVMIYTSGSTGKPKGVMLTHGNLRYLADTSAGTGAIQASDKVYFALPLSHSYGLTTVMLCTLAAGGCLYPVARFSAEKLADAILGEGITVFQGVPAMYARLLEFAAGKGRTLIPNCLRMCYIGGSMIDAERKAAVEALLAQPLHHGYGLTEAAPTVTRTIGGAAPSTTTVGWPFPGVKLTLRDSTGLPVEPGTEGELWVRGPNIMKGYYRDEAQSREAVDAQGWLHTGDLARVGDAGELYIVGRIKELIIRGGFNVYPAEVEAAIGAYPGVAQCAVLGRPVDGDEEVVAFIEPQAAATIDTGALEQFLRGQLAPYKIPRRYVLMDRLPASGTGKLLKAALKPMLEPDGPRGKTNR
jgi:acyl-CoA synthetase (AMP-forming)/AMP-acid ligase II